MKISGERSKHLSIRNANGQTDLRIIRINRSNKNRTKEATKLLGIKMRNTRDSNEFFIAEFILHIEFLINCYLLASKFFRV